MRIGTIVFIISLIIISDVIIKRDYNTPPYIDPVLNKYIDEWKKDMDSADIEYIARFNEIDSITIYNGKEYGISHMRKVKVNTKILRSEWLTRQTVYHELGHNIFNLEHEYSECIMHSTNLGEDFYKENWMNVKDYYLNKCKNQ